jgi:predicted AlkP superfamily pyrophosphatase or phosphodiesterase
MTPPFRILTLLALFLHGCGSFIAPPPPPPTPALPPTTTPTLNSISTPVTETPLPTPVFQPEQPIKRVLIVTFDGLRPEAIEAANMQAVRELMKTGAYTLSAQTVKPSLTLPAHASMVTGTCPAKHVVRWNEYVPENGYALGTDIFDLAKAAGLRTVLVTGKEKLRQITEPASTDFFGFVDATDRIKDIVSLESMAITEIRKDFGLMLMHFPDGDLAGHEYGWMSTQQLSAYRRDDDSFDLLLDVMKSRNLYDDTLIVVTSDHGGHDTTHGTTLPEDMTISWIVSGPRVVTGRLETQVHIMDTAATIAYALGLPLPPEWDGVPVYEAFGVPAEVTRSGGCPGVTP